MITLHPGSLLKSPRTFMFILVLRKNNNNNTPRTLSHLHCSFTMATQSKSMLSRVKWGLYTCILKYISIPFSVSIVLLLGLFSGLIVCYWITNLHALPWRRLFVFVLSVPELSIVLCLQLRSPALSSIQFSRSIVVALFQLTFR